MSTFVYLLTDGQGIPPAVSLTGCNRNDATQLLPLLDKMREPFRELITTLEASTSPRTGRAACPGSRHTCTNARRGGSAARPA